MKKTLLALMLCLTLFALCSGTALAQSRRPLAAATSTPRTIKPMAPDALRKIFSNLGSPTDAYDSANGLFVMGDTNTLFGVFQHIAVPFRPRADSTVTAVKMALQYYGYGANAARAAIYSDAAGLPGSELAGADLKNFVAFGTGCCVLAQWKLRTPLPVTMGTKYWLVGTTDGHSTDSVNVWDYVWDDKPGNLAFEQTGTGWIGLTAANGYPPSAGAVLGTVP